MKTNTLPVTTEDMFIRDVEGIAFHECGHLVVAHHFGHLANFKVWVSDEPRPDPRMLLAMGVCQHRPCGPKARSSHFIRACICWGGIVADILRTEGAGFRTELDEFRWEFQDALESLSDPLEPELRNWTDRVGIFGHHQRWRAAKKAFEIIMANRQAMELAVQKVRHDLVDLRERVTWINPEDIGLQPHVRYALKSEVAA